MRKIIMMILSLFLVWIPVFAQTTEVEGTVKDDQGNPMAKVKIVCEHVAIAGVKTEMMTNKRGEFYNPMLLYHEPGTWRMYPIIEGYLVRHIKVESRDSRKELLTNVDTDLGITQNHPQIIAKPGGKVIIDFIVAPRSSFEQGIVEIAGEDAATAPPEVIQLSTLDRARSLYSQGKLEESIELYEKASTEEKSATIYLEMSKIFMELKRLDDAAESLRKALAIDPKLPMMHYSLANILRKKGEIPSAVEELKKELEISPDSSRVLSGLAELYMESGQEGNAEAVYQKIIEQYPDDVNAYIALGRIYSRKGDYTRSEQAYRKVIELNPRNADTIYYNVGVSIINKKNITASDKANAMEAFQKAVELNPNHAGAHLQLGYLLLASGKIEEAKSHFKKFVDLNPGSPDAEAVKVLLGGL
ncbi:MAG: tetratricopeptide repeat protein [Acidobacteriota bacterium]